MGYYKCRRPGYLTAQQISVCEHIFQGKKEPWILEHDYGVIDPESREYKNARSRLYRLKNNPKFIEYFNSIVTEFRVHGYGKAMHKLTDMIDNDNPWVALQAANTVLAHTERAVINETENTVTVKIEGLPTLGVPPSEEMDALEDANRLILDAGEVVEAVESSVI